MTTAEIYNDFTSLTLNAAESLLPVVRQVQSSYDRIVNERDWENSAALVDVTSDSNGTIMLPEDFKKLTDPRDGRPSSIWIKTDKTFTFPIYVVSPSNLGRYDSISGGNYSIFRRDVSDNTLKFFNGRKRLNTEFRLNYNKLPEKLIDDSEPKLIPRQYHELISFRMAIDYYMKSQLSSEQRDTYSILKKNYDDLYDGFVDYDNNLFDGR